MAYFESKLLNLFWYIALKQSCSLLYNYYKEQSNAETAIQNINTKNNQIAFYYKVYLIYSVVLIFANILYGESTAHELIIHCQFSPITLCHKLACIQLFSAQLQITLIIFKTYVCICVVDQICQWRQELQKSKCVKKQIQSMSLILNKNHFKNI